MIWLRTIWWKFLYSRDNGAKILYGAVFPHFSSKKYKDHKHNRSLSIGHEININEDGT